MERRHHRVAEGCLVALMLGMMACSAGVDRPDGGPDCGAFRVTAPALTSIPRDGSASLTFGASATATFSLTSGALPPGMSLSSAGSLTGTPTAAGSYPLEVTATSEQGCAVPVSFSLAVECPAIDVQVPSLAGTVYTSLAPTALTQTGAHQPTFGVASGALPPGLTLAADGSLDGIPTEAGSFTFAAKVEDVDGCTGASPEVTMPVDCPAATIDVQGLADGGTFNRDALFLVGSPTPKLTFTIGGIAAAFSLSDGGLPEGVSVADGGLVGSPTALGAASSFTIRGDFGGSCHAERTFTEASCTFGLPLPAGWTPQVYYTGSTPFADGSINGLNLYADKEKAAYFDLSSQSFPDPSNVYLGGVWLKFGRAKASAPGRLVPLHVYDGTSGAPGAELGSPPSLSLDAIVADVDAGVPTIARFDDLLALPASKKVFVSIDLTLLSWQQNEAADSLGLYSNTDGQTTPSEIWERQSDGNWYQYTTAGSWNLSASLYLLPEACQL